MAAGDSRSHRDVNAEDTYYNDVPLIFGTNGDFTLKYVFADAALELLNAADDQVLKVGNGTKSTDLWLYGNLAADYLLWDASASQLSLHGAATFNLTGAVRTVTAKTTDYPVVAADSGKVFTTLGAGASVTFTLPAVATSAGLWFTFVNAVGQTMVITAPANKLVTFNNATATSLTFSTSSELIGAAVQVVCDGAFWYAMLMTEETQTVTVS